MRPTLFPRLSQFCINLTGIRQNLIDTEQTFNAVYLKLADWIERIRTEKNVRFATSSERSADRNGINATFGSWSDTDLQIFFKMECRRLHITALPCFTAWIDVRKSFDVSSLIPKLWLSQKPLNIIIFFFVYSNNIHLDGANFRKPCNMLESIPLDNSIQLSTMLKIWQNWWFISPNAVHNTKQQPVAATIRLLSTIRTKNIKSLVDFCFFSSTKTW